MLTSNDRVGFYGKLPIVGDFVHRRLPQDFVKPWDSWLQSAILASREQLGANWTDRYLNSSIWRFVLSPGICGNKAVAGIMMPSVDKVGRYYPLTVAVLFEESSYLPNLATQGNYWFKLLEHAALNALENDLELQNFDLLIQSIPAFSLTKLDILNTTLPSFKKTFYKAIESSEQLNDAFVSLNANILDTFMPGYSLWNTNGSDCAQPALLVCEGLPSLDSFSLFLNGRGFNQNESITANTLFDSPKEYPDTTEQSPDCVGIEESEFCNLSEALFKETVSYPYFATHWQSWAITDTGKRRKQNEDSLLNKPEARLWVVADGMGGHKAGDVASQLIVNRLNGISSVDLLEDYIAKVADCLQNINTELRQLAREKYANLLVGSTVVVLICNQQHCAFLWAGDSRLYRLRNNQLQQLTQDHCADDQEKNSVLSVKTANVITRAIGADDSLILDAETTDIAEGDVFLLCSDGLDKEVSFKEIENIMQNSRHEAIATTLVNEVLNRGARDNVTVIVIAQHA